MGRDRRSNRIEASQKFRKCVLHELKGLYPLPTNWPGNLGIEPTLRSIFPQLQIAVTEFRPFIPWYCRKAFDRAWCSYRNDTGRDIDYQCYLHYVEHNDNPNPRDNFRRNVDKLLSFAKYH